jgi:tetratricopeptide (TPR) repeat protein
MNLGNNQAAVAAFTGAAVLEREVGDKFFLAITLGFQAGISVLYGIDLSVRARAAAEEALALVRELDERRWMPLGLTPLMIIEGMQGNEVRAQLLRKEMRQYLDQVDHPQSMSFFVMLGVYARYEGRLDDARLYFLKALKMTQRFKTRQFEASMQSELAHLARQSGDLQQAMAAYRRLILTWKDFGMVPAVANMLECFAFIAEKEHGTERAARLLGAAAICGSKAPSLLPGASEIHAVS